MRVTLSALISIVMLSVTGCVLPTVSEEAQPTVPSSTEPADVEPDGDASRDDAGQDDAAQDDAGRDDAGKNGSGEDDASTGDVGAEDVGEVAGEVDGDDVSATTDAEPVAAGETDSDDSARAVSATPTDEIPAEEWDAIVDLFDRELRAIRSCLDEMPECDTSVFEEFGTDDYFEFMDEAYADPDSWTDTYVEDVDQFNRRVSFEGRAGDVIQVRVCETDATSYTDAEGEVLTDDLYSWRGIYSVEESGGDWLISDITTLDEGYDRGGNVCAVT